MRSLTLALAALAGIAAIAAFAQAPPLIDPATGARPSHDPGVGSSLPLSDKSSNTGPADTRSAIAPTLPGSAAGENAASRDYLRAARTSLVSNRTGQAQQSLEMAETRLLDRAVLLGQTGIPSDSSAVTRIRDARIALGEGDRARALNLIDRALAE